MTFAPALARVEVRFAGGVLYSASASAWACATDVEVDAADEFVKLLDETLLVLSGIAIWTSTLTEPAESLTVR